VRVCKAKVKDRQEVRSSCKKMRISGTIWMN